MGAKLRQLAPLGIDKGEGSRGPVVLFRVKLRLSPGSKPEKGEHHGSRGDLGGVPSSDCTLINAERGGKG